MARMNGYAGFAQALEPGAQQWRGLHVGGEDATGSADEGVDAQPVNPGAQGFAVECIDQRRKGLRTLAVARQERLARFGMGDVHAAHAGQQELASYRGHGIEQLYPHVGAGQDFGRHQAGGAAADDDGGTGSEWAGIGHARGQAKESGKGRNSSAGAPGAGCSFFVQRSRGLRRRGWQVLSRSLSTGGSTVAVDNARTGLGGPE